MKYIICLMVFLFSSCILTTDYIYVEPECRYSDDCLVNEMCEQSICEQYFPAPFGPLVKDSATSICVLWNSSSSGIPMEMIRYNPWCLSKAEIAIPCNDQFPRWMRVCN